MCLANSLGMLILLSQRGAYDNGEESDGHANESGSSDAEDGPRTKRATQARDEEGEGEAAASAGAGAAAPAIGSEEFMSGPSGLVRILFCGGFLLLLLD